MNITVYCSSRVDLPDHYVALARLVGEWIGAGGHRLVFGGCNAGLMHVVAQACHDSGGAITGVITEAFRPRLDPLVDTEIVAPDLGHRKARMIALADAFVVLPGGLGTIDEWLSTLSQLVVDTDTRRPIIVANPDGLFDATFAQLRQLADSPLAGPFMLSLSRPCADADALRHELDALADGTNNNNQPSNPHSDEK